VAEDAVEEGRQPDRSGDVRAEADRRAARADGGALAARGTAGDAGAVVGVERPPVDAVVRLDPHRHLGDVGDAERDQAGVEQPLRRRRVLLAAEVAAGDEPAAVRHPAQADGLLHGEGDPEQRRQVLVAGGDAGVGGVGLGARLLEAVADDGVEAAALEHLDVGLDHLARGRLTGADRPGELERGALGEGLCPRSLDRHRGESISVR
jgi:hypothetical protein